MRLEPVDEADCPFCQRIARGEYDSTGSGIYFFGPVVSFVPLNPVTRGHRLFVPYRHVKVEATGPVMEHAVRFASQRGEDYNLITSRGSAATQTIEHLHVHYVPRRNGDGLYLPWTGQHTTPKEQ